VSYEDVTVKVDAFHFCFLARKWTVFFFARVLRALKETVSPDLVLNFRRDAKGGGLMAFLRSAPRVAPEPGDEVE
jgi:hypothetical protein